MRITALAVRYFAYVFALGFGLGVVRTLWLGPLLGERNAELVEMPVMVTASWLVARWLLGRARPPLGVGAAAAAGTTALALLVCAEIGVVTIVRGQTLGDYVATRDRVSGAAYLVALVLFAAMPAVVAGLRRSAHA